MDILYKTTGDNRYRELPSESIKDIALEEIIDRMTANQDEKTILKNIMFKIPQDPADMIYRQEMIRDLMDNEDLCEAIRNCIDSISVLSYYGRAAKQIQSRDNALFGLLEDLRELKVYVAVVEDLYKALSENEIRSEGFKSIRDRLKNIVEDENFKAVKPDIDKIHDDLSNVKGALVGVTLTPDLDIDSVSAIEFVDFKPRSHYDIADVSAGSKFANPLKAHDKMTDPLLVSITPYMKKHLWKHFGEIKRLINKHAKYDTHFLTDLYNGLVFYLCAADLGKRLSASGHTVSFPKITSDSPLEVKNFYNIRLTAEDQAIVKNNFAFSDKERLFILTGPNRGGKTILEQGLGLISVMASLGMFVTADSFTGLPFSNILTHFPVDENLTINYGRLGEEAVRIKEIVKDADDNTLILFNETFSTTSAADAVYLAKDLIHILKEKGSYVIFNTHLHELGSCISEMNAWEGRSNIISIVMEIKDDKNTFKVKRSDPDTSSYARNIAEKYGITYEQLSSELS